MNTSELVPKITEAHSVSKMQAQGIVDSMLKGLTLQRRTAVKDGGSEVAARQASQPRARRED